MSEGTLERDGWQPESIDVTSVISVLKRRFAKRRRRAARSEQALILRGSDAAGLVAVSTHRFTVLGTATGARALNLEVSYAARGPAIGTASDKRFTIAR